MGAAQMLRVLKPGGMIAFSTWPPDHYTAKFFALTAKYLPPPPGIAPPPEWGNPEIVKTRLGTKVTDLVFDRSLIQVPALSPQHVRLMFEKNCGSTHKVSKRFERRTADARQV